MSKKFFKSFLLKIQMSKKLLKHLLFFDSYSLLLNPSYSYVFTTPVPWNLIFWGKSFLNSFRGCVHYSDLAVRRVIVVCKITSKDNLKIFGKKFLNISTKPSASMKSFLSIFPYSSRKVGKSATVLPNTAVRTHTLHYGQNQLQKLQVILKLLGIPPRQGIYKAFNCLKLFCP